MTIYGGPDIITDGLVLHLDAANSKSYSGSGTVWNDLSGNGNNGTLTNEPTYSLSNKGSIVFDGVNDYINCGKPSTLNFGTGSFSVCLFVRPSNSNVLQVLATKGSNGNSGWWIGLDNRYNSNTNGVSMVVSSLSSNTSYGGKSTLSRYVSSTWNHLAGIWDQNANDIYLYINGILSSTTLSQTGGSSLAGVTDITNINYNTIIMAYDVGASFNVNGTLGNISLYNRALSSTEIQQNYNATKGRYNL